MNDVAKPGETYVCSRCGRRSKDRLGRYKVHSGWGENCAINAVKCRIVDLIIAPRSGIVTGFKPGAAAIPVAPN